MRTRDPLRALLLGIAIPSFVFYVGWNLYFLGSGRIPPSILYHFTGVPSPTTGCVRALVALFEFRLLDSARLNPFLLVFLAMLLLTPRHVLRQRKEVGRMRLAKGFTTAWLLTLVLSSGYQIAFRMGL
jgi:hypothetical protein